jgi:hypothetical protein
MFGFGGTKKSTTSAGRTKLIGADLTASRIRALAVAGGHANAISLDSPTDELALFIHLEGRSPSIGLSGYSQVRKTPHLVCSNYLPQLGHAREWRGPKLKLTPETALEATFAKIHRPITSEGDGCVFALPAYLSGSQVKTLTTLAAKSKLPLVGTASAPLALAAHRASNILQTSKPKKKPDGWVVPIRESSGGPGDVVILDVDEYAISAAIVNVQDKEVRLSSLAAWPRLSLKLWKDRLIDSLSDRCVRLCRRDPRDSADAEQALFEQLDFALEKVQDAQPVTLTVRAEKWYQDLVMQPTDFDSATDVLTKLAVESYRDFLTKAKLSAPPVALWLSTSAARLPGLVSTLYKESAENTEVAVLPPDAVTEAAAALHARWQANELPRVHLDGVIALHTEPKAKPETRKQKSI